MKTNLASVVKISVFFSDNKQLEISTVKQDHLFSSREMLRSRLNAILPSKERKDSITFTLNFAQMNKL